MSNPFFDHPILNSPYERPMRHWELDRQGQPTQRILETRRRAEFITPIPKPKKRKGAGVQEEMIWVRLFSAKLSRPSRRQFELIIHWCRTVVALALLTIMEDDVVIKIAAGAKGAQP